MSEAGSGTGDRTVKLGKYRHNKTGGIYYTLLIVTYTGTNAGKKYVVYCDEKIVYTLDQKTTSLI